MNFKKYHVSRNLINAQPFTIEGDSSSHYITLLSGTLPTGTYTFSLNQDSNLTSAVRNTIRITIGSTAHYESPTDNYHLQSGQHKMTFTISDNSQGVEIAYWGNALSNDCSYSNIMLNEGSTPLPYEHYSSEVWHDTPHYIMGTSTDTITTLPADLYADGNSATVGISGNMVQSGTPTPDNPIMPQSCGERTAQLWDISSWDGAKAQRGTLERVTNGYKLTATSNDAYTITYGSGIYSYSVIGGNEYTISWTVDNPLIYGIVYIFTGTSVADTPLTTAVAASGSKTFTVPSGHNYVAFRLGVSSIGNEITYTNIMLNTGSEALPYEPYGYKIPISSASTTTPVYLGEVETTRRIKKYVFDGTENWAKGDYPPSGSYQFGIPKSVYFPDAKSTISNGETFCTHFINRQIAGGIAWGINFNIYMLISDLPEDATADDFKAFLAAQYAAGKPVTIWYVLATPTTGIVNEPIRKIGDYADEVSGITIPTIAGANAVDVLTTLKPSEVSVNYKGWHTGAVHERDSGQWD